MYATLPVPANNDYTPGDRPTQDEGKAALRFFFNIMPKWRLNEAEARTLLGDVAPATFYRWKKGEVGVLPSDTIWRLGDILGISKGLRYMFHDPERGYEWLRKPNAAFHGHSALDVMVVGHPGELARVRRYLDAERGGW
jgi:hypothetical protein